MLSDDEIRRRLRAIRHSSRHERNARRAPSINATAAAAGLSRETLYCIARDEPIGQRARRELTRVLTCQG